MGKTSDMGIGSYNSFCKGLKEGTILYNVDSTNCWGDYLLVVNKTSIQIGSVKTYTVLLLGLKKEDSVFKSRHLRISMTPDYASHVPFLKYVGYSKFELLPVLKDVDVNMGLVAAYGTTDLRKYAQRLSIRKPQSRRYDKDGKPVIKKPSND